MRSPLLRTGRQAGLIVVLAMLLLSTSSEADSAQVEATEFIRAAMGERFTAVKSERPAIENDPKLARALVRDILTPHFDLERTCRWVLGKHWRQATDAQRDRVVEEFRTLLVRIYAAAVTDFATLEMNYQPIDQVASSVDAAIRVEASADGGEPIAIVYCVHRDANGWKVYDILVEGVSLVTTYRSSFSAEIRKGGMDGLIERLAERNRQAS